MAVGWIGLALLVIGIAYAFFWRPAKKKKQRLALMARPMSDDWHSIIRERVPQTRQLPARLYKRMKGLVQVFLAEKRFEGCGGLKITDEIRVTIAAQACMMLTGLDTIHPYPDLTTILVYPAAYSARNASSISSGGIVSDRQFRAGESWDRGVVVLSWDHVYDGSANSKDGRNVVFHEFAHQLEQAHGPADGVPD